jgi:hypothetical protein
MRRAHTTVGVGFEITCVLPQKKKKCYNKKALIFLTKIFLGYIA